MRLTTVLLGLAASTPALPALSQDVTHPDNVFIGGNLNVTGNGDIDGTLHVDGIARLDDKVCIGNTCGTTESIGLDDLIKLKYVTTSIYFNDTSSVGNPSGDWRLLINDQTSTGFGGIDRFSVEDVSNGTIPFTIASGVPANSFWLASNGHIGMGTHTPLTNLHIVDDTTAALAFELTALSGGSPQSWALFGDQSAFGINDVTTDNDIFHVASGAPEHALTVDTSGAVGLGTSTPTAGSALHITRSDGTAQALITETSSTSSPRTLLNLQNNGRPEIIMGNTGTNGEWSFGAGTNFILKSGAVGSVSSAKAKAATFKPNGDLTIEGVLTTAGGTCGGGCDLVFTDSYDLPSIKEHADKMWKLGYLPNVGPTVEGAPINVSDKLGRMLNELEHAHIYIAELEQRDRDRLAEIKTQREMLSDLQNRLAQIEQKLR